MKQESDKGCMMCDYGILDSDESDEVTGGKWLLAFDEWGTRHSYRFCSIDCLKEWVKDKTGEWGPK